MIAAFGLGLALVIAPGLQTAPSSTDVDRRFREERLIRAGFPPLQPAGSFRRLLLSDPYMMLPVPGLEMRRRASGELDLVLQYPAWRSEPIPVDPALWDVVPAERLFPEPVVTPIPPPAPSSSVPPPICHGWSALVQDDAGRLASWHACGGETSPIAEFAAALINAAVAAEPDCAPDEASPYFAFQRCFGLKPELEDPALEAVFAPLRREREAIRGAEILAAARRSLQAPEMRRDDAAWFTANESVQAVKATLDQHRDLSRRLAELSFGSPHASPADHYTMSRTLEHWSNSTASQDRNYIDLLEQLLAVER